MKILNLYAGLWWNRSLWWDNNEVTAVEINSEIARIYQDRFPKDKVIVWDAHEYLEENFKEFDFIRSSPPCQSHSSFRQNICVRYRWTKPIYPDMKLWQEITFLKYNFDGDWVVENVKPYYKPFIEPSFVLQRHYFRSNKAIEKKEFESDRIRTAQIKDLEVLHWIDLSKYKISNKRQILRNCVHKEVWKHVLDAFGVKP